MIILHKRDKLYDLTIIDLYAFWHVLGNLTVVNALKDYTFPKRYVQLLNNILVICIKVHWNTDKLN